MVLLNELQEKNEEIKKLKTELEEISVLNKSLQRYTINTPSGATDLLGTPRIL